MVGFRKKLKRPKNLKNVPNEFSGNQMLHKSQVPQSNVIRKKGPFGAGKRPRLAPYYMTNPSKKVPRKSLPRLQHTQQRLESNQNYTESLEPVYNHCEDLKPGTSQMNAVVKREPGLDGEDEPSAENQIYMENMTNAFPSSNYLSEKKRNDAKVKIEGMVCFILCCCVFFMPPISIDWGHIVFALSISVYLQKTLSLVITFEWLVIEISYFTCVIFAMVSRLRSSAKVKFK